MTPLKFEGANTLFRRPPDLEESQCGDIDAFRSVVTKGPLEGAVFVVTAWKPSADELKQLNDGNPVFLTVLGGLPPHALSTNLAQACNL